MTLYELNHIVSQVISSTFIEPMWLEAEVMDVHESRGHCYMEFVQKHKHTETIIAKARGQVWAQKWAVIRPYFEQVTGQRLAAGMKVLVLVEVTFHEQYGYSLNIVDINPTFTLGDIARRRQEILQQLEEEGIADMNKELPLPRLLQRIAVISASGAAGWGDFHDQLINNAYGLAFRVELFEAVMQGERVEQSIISALNRIAHDIDNWDVVVIIRGGGASADLNGFDTLPLAENVAQFPLPVITGIGHERDDTVLDFISHTRVKTPTAAAEFILQHQLDELTVLASLQERLISSATNVLTKERLRMERMTMKLPSLFSTFKNNESHRLDLLWLQMTTALRARLQAQHNAIDLYEAKLRANTPEHVLRLGYSIVRHNGKAVTSANALSLGDEIIITHADGTTSATVSSDKRP